LLGVAMLGADRGVEPRSNLLQCPPSVRLSSVTPLEAHGEAEIEKLQQLLMCARLHEEPFQGGEELPAPRGLAVEQHQ